MKCSLLGEMANYDFKEKMPDSKKVAQEVCAFANLAGGGLLLIGIDNTGNNVGVPRADLDGIQLSIINSVKSTCAPRPEVDFKIFDVPEHRDRCVLTVQISELMRKPCMVDGRAYIRTGASARPAGPMKFGGWYWGVTEGDADGQPRAGGAAAAVHPQAGV